jgi:hypothetical protein
MKSGRVSGTCGVGRRDACRVLARSPKVKRSLGRPRRRWKDNNKINIQEVEWGGMDWIGVAENRKK